ncbi:MAG: CoA pyrophosphatase [Clostridiales Family XIII bacterium]|jgi:8-oxo-dGTP pyrophosphatase MutT (NUDIX family)|nr:CoA pyrophosphatase [Clostridiales Family XIII bacterium]
MVTITDFRKAIENRMPRPIGAHKYFSVLAPLVVRGGELHFLFELRSENLRRQPGEVSFPGGKVERGESPRECAIRETSEELGIPQAHIEVLGELDYIPAYSDTLYSFLGVLPDADYEKTMNRDEVREIFLAPAAFFMENEPEVYSFDVRPKVDEDFPYGKIRQAQGYKWRSSTMTVPIYSFGDKVIWGMTARITWNLVRILKEAAVQ